MHKDGYWPHVGLTLALSLTQNVSIGKYKKGKLNFGSIKIAHCKHVHVHVHIHEEEGEEEGGEGEEEGGEGEEEGGEGEEEGGEEEGREGEEEGEEEGGEGREEEGGEEGGGEGRGRKEGRGGRRKEGRKGEGRGRRGGKIKIRGEKELDYKDRSDMASKALGCSSIQCHLSQRGKISYISFPKQQRKSDNQ